MDTTENWKALMLSVYEGCSAEEAIEAFGLKIFRHKPGRPRNTESSRWNKEELMRIRYMRRNKVSWRKISIAIGVDVHTAYRAYYKFGPKLLDDWQPGKE